MGHSVGVIVTGEGGGGVERVPLNVQHHLANILLQGFPKMYHHLVHEFVQYILVDCYLARWSTPHPAPALTLSNRIANPNRNYPSPNPYGWLEVGRGGRTGFTACFGEAF